MPILDPSLQLYLLRNFKMDEYSRNDFFIRYLEIASLYFNKNSNTVQASLNFKKDLISCSSIINKIFGGNISFQNDLENPSIKDYYSYLLEKIHQNYSENISEEQEGFYYYYYNKYSIRLFQPLINFPKLRAWYFTDSPIAILCVNLNNFQKNDEKIISYINLEIDLMAASGFTLVLCFIGKINLDIINIFIRDTISTHQFAEIHFNYSSVDSNKEIEINSTDLHNFLEKNEEYFTNNGYFYFYTKFPEESEQKNYFKKYKSQIPFFQLIFFSTDMLFAFKQGTMKSNFECFKEFPNYTTVFKPFIYCKTGFDQDMIRILLCNVPLYNSSNEDNDLIPFCTSGFSFAYIMKNDFLNCEDFRVHILFDDITNNRNYIDKYVDFDDIHLIRPDFYVKDALYLTRTDKKTLKKIDEIQTNANKKDKNGNDDIQTNANKKDKNENNDIQINANKKDKNEKDDFKKENIFHFFKNKQIKKGLEYVIYAYQHYANHFSKIGTNFRIHSNQIFAAFDACKVCLLKNKSTEKGVIYQVETGEGKSCIIQLIAAVLALSKKTVHITSSNINLANRDYYDSFNFFKQLNLESAVLLHYNELPYINFQNLPNDDTEYKKEFYPPKFFKSALFDNPSNMNLSVCGFNNKNELMKDNKANIVFSTFINFESLYLRIMEIYPSYIHKYFNDCSLLIDEADSILIDELTNGTILSRPMNTNGKEILAFVYKSYCEKIDASQVFNDVKTIWPECVDLSENDILEMYKEIDIVNQKEFTNGKKYSIEKVIDKDYNYIKKKKAEDIVNVIKNLDLDEAKELLTQMQSDSVEHAYIDFANLKYKDAKKNSKDKKKLSKEKSIDKNKGKSTEKNKEKSTDKDKEKSTDKNKEKSDDKNKEKSTDKNKEKSTEKNKEKSTDKNKEKSDDKNKEKSDDKNKEKSDDKNKEKSDDKNKEKSTDKDKEKSTDKDKEKSTDKNKEKSDDKNKEKSVEKSKRKSIDKHKGKLVDEKEEDISKSKEIEKRKRRQSIDQRTKNKSISNEYKIIVPFDYENKGVLEPNKEFSGFIQQFIAIKEMFNDQENENMLIKDISMNYFYVSHPIFVNLYGGVCGFTGTIGGKYDKKIYQDHYKLITKKIPRNAPNHRIHLPIILCSSIKERNKKIVDEVNEFHLKGNPVLVIFKELNEIFYVYHELRSKGIKNINIFDGKDEKIKPDYVSGTEGAISLGTNICGRGTDIKEPSKPLHVIVTYYTSNTRVIHQAFGRTARQGNDGTVRIICLINQYILPQQTINEDSMNDILDDFLLKNNMQIKFIEDIREKRKWIFDSHIKSQKINNDYIKKMRNSRINVNRIKAYNYKFPLCMKFKSFVNIQSQKIFSLFNCPNCKYTWMLFQRYLRELILETWSLFITQSDQEYYSNNQSITYKDFLMNKVAEVKDHLELIIPSSQNQNDYDIVPTFMHIFDYVTAFYENKILSSFPPKISNCFTSTDNSRFCSFFIGFKPYSLFDKSGSRINSFDNKNHEHEFIIDPELKYMKKQPNGLKSILISITEKIDDIFNKICKKINDVIGSYLGLKFFLRRTLGGCEFGVCFDFELENLKEKDIGDLNCLFDKDPLLVFTINVKSMVPILAGILIIGLVYISRVCIKIVEIVSGFDITLVEKIAVNTVKAVIDKFAPEVFQEQIDCFCNLIFGFLTKVIVDQIGILRTFNFDLAFIFGLLLKIATVKDFANCDGEINKMFDDLSYIKMNQNFKKKIPMNYICKIGFLLMLTFASFMMNFHYKKIALQYNTQQVANDYNKNQKTDEAVEANEKYVEENYVEEKND